MLTAETATRFGRLYKIRGAYELYISLDCAGRDRICKYTGIKGKREARKLAAEINVLPWNF